MSLCGFLKLSAKDEGPVVAVVWFIRGRVGIKKIALKVLNFSLEGEKLDILL